MKIRILASLFLCAALAGCGFHLRGGQATTTHIEALTVVGTGHYGKMGRAMEKQLKLSHIESNTPESWHLTILNEKMDNRTLAFSDDNYPATREMVLEVRFTVTDPHGNTVIAPNTERVVRVLESDSNRRLASDREQDLMRQEMYDDMAANLLRRIDYFASQSH